MRALSVCAGLVSLEPRRQHFAHLDANNLFCCPTPQGHETGGTGRPGTESDRMEEGLPRRMMIVLHSFTIFRNRIANDHGIHGISSEA